MGRGEGGEGGRQGVSGRLRLVTLTCAPSCPVSLAAVSALTLAHVCFFCFLFFFLGDSETRRLFRKMADCSFPRGFWTERRRKVARRHKYVTAIKTWALRSVSSWVTFDPSPTHTPISAASVPVCRRDVFIDRRWQKSKAFGCSHNKTPTCICSCL